MSKVEALIRAQAKPGFKALNPHIFNVSHVEAVKPSKPATANPGAIALTPGNSSLSDKFKLIWKLLDAPKLEEEFKFHPERKFRVDFCHLATRTCIEIEGGIFNKRGGHSSITGILRDIEKYNEMVYLGFRLIRFHANSINVENLTRLARFLESRQYVS